jgi:CheY-like chemotaxis protein
MTNQVEPDPGNIEPAETAASGALGSGNILVADDDGAVLKITVGILEKAGYHCEGVLDAQEASRLLSSREFDLLISDLEMPGNEGLRLIRDVPQIAAGLPVILMTGYPTLDSAIQALQLPVSAYLVKPFNQDALLQEVARAIQRCHAYRAVRVNHHRIEEWNQALARLETAMKTSRQTDFPAWQMLFDLTLRNITDALKDLRVFADIMSPGPSTEPPTPAANAARPLLLLNAVHEAIDVLEKTKHSFRSKELGELRKKLASLVETREESSSSPR